MLVLAEFTQHIPPKGAHLIDGEDSASLRPLPTLDSEAATGRGGGWSTTSRGCFSDTPTGSSDQAGELTFVDMDTFLATF